MSKGKQKSYVRDGNKIRIPSAIYKVLEDGIYVAEIVKAEIKESYNGNEIIRCKFKTDSKKVGVFDIFITDDPKAVIWQLMKACSEEGTKEIEVEQLIGHMVKIYVRTRDIYQNVVRVEEIDWAEDVDNEDELEDIDNYDELEEDSYQPTAKKQSNRRSPGVGRGSRVNDRH